MEYNKRNKKLFKQRVQLLLAAITIWMTIHLYFLLYNVSIALDNQNSALLRPPTTTNSSLQQHGNSRSWAKRHFQEVGISLDNDTLTELPTNYEIIKLFGKEPLVVMGSNSLSRVEASSDSNNNNNRHHNSSVQCNNFYKRVPDPKDRWIGVAGFFNTGTNLLYQLLKANCVMPNNNSVFWQVPWGKHAFATLSRNQTAKGKGHAIKDNGLAIVATRNPFAWSHSMCKHPYVIKWEYTEHCPSATSQVLSWGGHSNLYTFYNSYYSKYWKDFHHPKIFVRLEDITLRPQSTISKVCNCAGGQMTAMFQHVTDRSTTDMTKAWKSVVASSNEINGGLLHIEEYTIAKQALDNGGLMGLFGYKHPPPSSSSRPYRTSNLYFIFIVIAALSVYVPLKLL